MPLFNYNKITPLLNNTQQTVKFNYDKLMPPLLKRTKSSLAGVEIEQQGQPLGLKDELGQPKLVDERTVYLNRLQLKKESDKKELELLMKTPEYQKQEAKEQREAIGRKPVYIDGKWTTPSEMSKTLMTPQQSESIRRQLADYEGQYARGETGLKVLSAVGTALSIPQQIAQGWIMGGKYSYDDMAEIFKDEFTDMPSYNKAFLFTVATDPIMYPFVAVTTPIKLAVALTSIAKRTGVTSVKKNLPKILKVWAESKGVTKEALAAVEERAGQLAKKLSPQRLAEGKLGGMAKGYAEGMGIGVQGERVTEAMGKNPMLVELLRKRKAAQEAVDFMKAQGSATRPEAIRNYETRIADLDAKINALRGEPKPIVEVKPTPTKQLPKAKEPWEMTPEEYLRSKASELGGRASSKGIVFSDGKFVPIGKVAGLTDQAYAVDKALAEGKIVPRETIEFWQKRYDRYNFSERKFPNLFKDYPDLQLPKPQATIPKATTSVQQEQLMEEARKLPDVLKRGTDEYNEIRKLYQKRLLSIDPNLSEREFANQFNAIYKEIIDKYGSDHPLIKELTGVTTQFPGGLQASYKEGGLFYKKPVSQPVKPVAEVKPTTTKPTQLESTKLVKDAVLPEKPPQIEPPKPPTKPPTAVAGGAEELPKPPELLTRPAPEKITKKPELIAKWKKAIADGDVVKAQELERSFINEIKSRRTTPIKIPAREIPPVEESAMTRIQRALDEATPLNKEQAEIYHQERAKRLAEALKSAKGLVGEAKLNAQLKQLKGEMPKVRFTKLKVTPEDVTELLETIDSHPMMFGYRSITARKAFINLLEGSVPRPYEMHLLKQVFPEELINAIKKKQGMSSKVWEKTLEALGVPRAIMATMDLSYGLRQGYPMMIRHPQIWSKIFFKDQFKYFAKEKYVKEMYKAVYEDPLYKLSQSGNRRLSLPDLDDVLSAREEAIMSGQMVEKIPVFGKFARMSNRAYTGFATKLRFDVFKEMVKKAELAGHKVEGKLLDDIINYVNTSTGRGSLGSFENSAVILNQAFFSPKLTASRFNMLLNPVYYTRMHPFARKEALKTLLASYGFITTAAGVAYLAGGKVGFDPRSADFLKLKIGNTRLDLSGGLSQYYRIVAQFVSGKLISSTSGKEIVLGEGYKAMDRLDIVTNFLKNKQAPVISFFVSLFSGKDNTGRPINVTSEVAQRFIPMVWQDLYDVAKDNPKLIPVELLGFFGAGVQTYSGYNPYGVDNADVNNVYASAIYSKWRHNEYNKLLKDGKRAEARQYKEDNPEIKDYARLSNAVEFFSNMKKRKESIQKDDKLSAGDKKAHIKYYDNRILERVKMVMGRETVKVEEEKVRFNYDKLKQAQ